MWDVLIPFSCFLQATDQEVDEVVTEYCQHAKNVFGAEELEFAKAVCCLKMIRVVKVGHG